MKYKSELILGTFLRRPNRFLAEVMVDGKRVMAHVPNTSRLSELTIEGVRVAVSYHDDENRKTKYSLRLIEKDGAWFSVDSQLPNDLVEEAIKLNVIEEVYGAEAVQREKTFGNSRFDFKMIDTEGKTVYMEVKGVTLEIENEGHFPGAPTKRGVKHLSELRDAVELGHRGIVVFVLQFNDAKAMRPNWALDPEFSSTLLEVSQRGVEVLAYACSLTTEHIEIIKRVPAYLEDFR